MLAKLHLYLVCLFIMGAASSSFGQERRPGSVPRDREHCEETNKPGDKPKSRFLQELLANDPHGFGKLGEAMAELKESATPSPDEPPLEEKLDNLSNRLRKFKERFFPEEEAQEENSPFTPQKPITDNDSEKPSKPPIVPGGEPLPLHRRSMIYPRLLWIAILQIEDLVSSLAIILWLLENQIFIFPQVPEINGGAQHFFKNWRKNAKELFLKLKLKRSKLPFKYKTHLFGQG